MSAHGALGVPKGGQTTARPSPQARSPQSLPSGTGRGWERAGFSPSSRAPSPSCSLRQAPALESGSLNTAGGCRDRPRPLKSPPADPSRPEAGSHLLTAFTCWSQPHSPTWPAPSHPPQRPLQTQGPPPALPQRRRAPTLSGTLEDAEEGNLETQRSLLETPSPEEVNEPGKGQGQQRPNSLTLCRRQALNTESAPHRLEERLPELTAPHGPPPSTPALRLPLTRYGMLSRSAKEQVSVTRDRGADIQPQAREGGTPLDPTVTPKAHKRTDDRAGLARCCLGSQVSTGHKASTPALPDATPMHPLYGWRPGASATLGSGPLGEGPRSTTDPQGHPPGFSYRAPACRQLPFPNPRSCKCTLLPPLPILQTQRGAGDDLQQSKHHNSGEGPKDASRSATAAAPSTARTATCSSRPEPCCLPAAVRNPMELILEECPSLLLGVL